MALIGQTLVPQSTPDVVISNVPCDSSVSIGDWVRMDAFGVAVRALADDLDNSNVIGLAEYKNSPTLCNIRVLGVSDPIFAGLDTTKEYFLSDTVLGGMGVSIPTLAGHIVLKVGQPFSATRILVLKGTRMQRA